MFVALGLGLGLGVVFVVDLVGPGPWEIQQGLGIVGRRRRPFCPALLVIVRVNAVEERRVLFNRSGRLGSWSGNAISLGCH